MTDLSEQDKALCEGSYIRGLYDLADMTHVGPEVGNVVRDAAAHIEKGCARIRELQAKIDALQQHAEAMAEALGAVMIGGNHIALLIGADHPPASTECEYALEHYGAGDQYDAWCCWRSLMRARKPLANWTAWLIDGDKA